MKPTTKGKMMSLKYVQDTYGAHIKVGARVRYTGGKEPQLGTIAGADGAYVTIRLDGEKRDKPYHPEWKLEYLNKDDRAPLGTPISELSGRPGHPGFNRFTEIAASWGYD